MTEALLSLDALEVRYAAVPALLDVNLRVHAGEAVALLGANGAGKSTLMKAIIGLLRPASGTIHFQGRRVDRLDAHRRARLGIGYCPEGRRVFPGLTVRENLQVACWGTTHLRDERLAAMLDLFPPLAEHQRAPAWRLSGGQQQMLAIARSLMDGPSLLLLDEPSLGLSPRLTDDVLGLVPDIVARGTAVLLAEQNAAKALQVCTRAAVLRLGHITADAPAQELLASEEIRAAFLGG